MYQPHTPANQGSTLTFSVSNGAINNVISTYPFRTCGTNAMLVVGPVPINAGEAQGTYDLPDPNVSGGFLTTFHGLFTGDTVSGTVNYTVDGPQVNACVEQPLDWSATKTG